MFHVKQISPTTISVLRPFRINYRIIYPRNLYTARYFVSRETLKNAKEQRSCTKERSVSRETFSRYGRYGRRRWLFSCMLAFRICSDFSRIWPRSVIIRQKFSLSFFKRNEYVLFTLQSYHVLHTIRYAARIFQECAAPYFCRAGRAIISNRTKGEYAARLAVVWLVVVYSFSFRFVVLFFCIIASISV